jgi:hypothetical protein
MLGKQADGATAVVPLAFAFGGLTQIIHWHNITKHLKDGGIVDI